MRGWGDVEFSIYYGVLVAAYLFLRSIHGLMKSPELELCVSNKRFNLNNVFDHSLLHRLVRNCAGGLNIKYKIEIFVLFFFSDCLSLSRWSILFQHKGYFSRINNYK